MCLFSQCVVIKNNIRSFEPASSLSPGAPPLQASLGSASLRSLSCLWAPSLRLLLGKIFPFPSHPPARFAFRKALEASRLVSAGRSELPCPHKFGRRNLRVVPARSAPQIFFPAIFLLTPAPYNKKRNYPNRVVSFGYMKRFGLVVFLRTKNIPFFKHFPYICYKQKPVNYVRKNEPESISETRTTTCSRSITTY